MIDTLIEVQFYANLLNTGISKFLHLLDFIIGPFNLPEKSVLIYPDFSNFYLSNYAIFRRDFSANILNS